jgi:hypothetical protein
MWSAGGLGEFKIRNGFQKIDLPRYYVPLTAKGRIAFALKLHRGVRGMLPPGFKAQLVELRSKWNAIRTPGPARSATDTPAPSA